MDKILIVGAGFAGAVLARELAETLECSVDVIDRRKHIAGNCHTERETESGVMEHIYGPHIFNTSHEDVWSYIQQYGEIVPYRNTVKAVTERGVYSLPINLLTINQFLTVRWVQPRPRVSSKVSVLTAILKRRILKNKQLVCWVSNYMRIFSKTIP